MSACPACNAPLPVDGRFCAACGARRDDDDPGATRQMTPPASTARDLVIGAAPPADPAATAPIRPPAPATRPAAPSPGPAPAFVLGGARLALYTVGVAVISATGAVLVARTMSRAPVAAPPAMVAAGAEDTSPAPPALDVPGADGREPLRAQRPRAAARPRPGVAAAPGEAPPAAGAGSPYDEILGKPGNDAPASKPGAAPAAPGAPASIPGASPDPAAGKPAPGGAPNSPGGAANSPGAAPAAPSVFLGDSNAEDAPPSVEDLQDRKQAEVYANGIRTVVRMHQSQVVACYERVFKDGSTPAGGRVELAFTIGQDGRAHAVTIQANTTGKDALGLCLKQRVAEWKFAAPPSGEFQASYPFIFSGAR